MTAVEREPRELWVRPRNPSQEWKDDVGHVIGRLERALDVDYDNLSRGEVSLLRVVGEMLDPDGRHYRGVIAESRISAEAAFMAIAAITQWATTECAGEVTS